MAGARRIEGALNRTESGADKLRRTVLRYAAVIGTLLSVRQIVQMADAYTSLQNRLRIVTASQRQLADVTDQLFRVSQRTATSFTATADLYARVALSSRELGVSQRELVRFTESVNKAILLSGASAQEANAGIIQFSQGIASGALRGDELRSVLEQLPFVADVIAEHLGITRGALRSLGEEGKITTEIILGAFREAADGLDEEFAGVQFTIGNGLQVVGNAFTQVIGRFNEMTNASQGLVQLLFGLASLIENSFLPVLTGMISAGSQAVDVFSSIANAVVAVGSGIGLGSLGDAVSSLAVSFEDLGYAIGQVVIALGASFLLGRLGALFRLFTAGATATGALTAAMVRLVAIVRVLGRLTGIIFIFESINAITSTEPEKLHAVGRAIRSVWDVFGDLPGPDVGEIIDSIGRLLTNLVGVVQGAAASIPGLFRDLGDSIGALIDAAGRLGGSVISAAIRHIRSFHEAAVDLGSSAIQRVAAVISGIFRAVSNFASSAFQRVPAAVQRVVRYLGDLYDRIASFVGGAIDRAAGVFGDIRDAIASLAIGDRIAVIIEWFQELYLAISAFASERLQGVVNFFERIGEGIANAYESVVGTVGDVYDRIVDRYRELSDGTVAIPEIVVTAQPTEELERAFRLTQSQIKALAELRDELDPLAVAEREVTEAQALLNDARRAGVITGEEYGSLLMRLNRAYQEQLEPVRLIHQELAREGDLRRVQIDQRETEAALLEHVRDLQEKGVVVTQAETDALRQAIQEQARHAHFLELERSLYDDLRDPVGDYTDQLEALANVVALHPELAEAAAQAQRELRLAFLDTQRDFASGFERGLLRVSEQFNDFASLAENAVTGWATQAEDALVRFVRTGKLAFGDLVDSILNDLARLAVRQFITAPIAGALGLGGIGGGGGVGNLLGLGNLFSGGGGGGGVGGFISNIASGVGNFLSNPIQSLTRGIGGITSSISSGFTSVVGGLSNGLASLGLGTSGAAAGASVFGTSIAGAGGTGLAGFVSSIGATLAPVAPFLLAVTPFLGDIFSGLFGRKLRSNEIVGTLGSEGFEGQQEAFFKGGLFRSNRRTREPVSDEVQTFLDTQAIAVSESVRFMAESLGQDATALADVTHAVRVNLRQDQEEIQADIAASVDDYANTLASLALGTSQYTLAGETQFETLARLSLSLVTANEALASLGHNLFDISLAGANASAALIDAFGGLDQFNEATQSYFRNFHTEAEQFAAGSRAFVQTLADLGASIPRTREEYRALVEAQDLTTESGRNTYAALLQLSEAAAQVFRSTEGSSELADIFNAEVERVEELARQTADAIPEAVDNLDSAFSDVLTGVDSLADSTADVAQSTASAAEIAADAAHRAQAAASSASSAASEVASILRSSELVRAASGGRITGPGTGTSDSIPALLSNGEFVVNAASTSRHLPLLESLNDNRPRFQTGGLVQAPRRGGGGETRVIVNYFGAQEPNIETVTTRRSDGGEDVTVSIRDVRRGDLDDALESRYGVRPVAA